LNGGAVPPPTTLQNGGDTMKVGYEEREEIIKEEYIKNDKTREEVAKILGIPVKTLGTYIDTHKLYKRKSSLGITKEDLVREYINKDVTREQAAEALGISWTQLRSLLYANKLKKKFIDPDSPIKNYDWMYVFLILNK
jgi:hypothetical protein